MKNRFIAIGKALCYALSFVLMQYLGAFAANAVYCAAQGWGEYAATGSVNYAALLQLATAFTEENATAIAALGDLLGLGALWAFFRLRKKRLCRETEWRAIPWPRLWPAFVCGALLAVGLCLSLELLPIPAGVMESYTAAASEVIRVNGYFSAMAVLYIAPLCEEVFFRGLVYTRLRRAFPKWAAALLASAVFGLIHAEPLWMLYAFCMALVMTFIYEKCGSLWASIAFHVAFNRFGVSWNVNGPSAAYWIILFAALAGAALLLIRIGRFSRNTHGTGDAACAQKNGGA